MLGLESLASIVQSLVDSARLDEEDEAAKKKGRVGGGRELEEDQAEEAEDQQALAAALAAGTAQAAAAAAGTEEGAEEGTTTTAANASATKPKAESSVIDAYAAKQALEEDITAGILKFNLKPKDGIKFLVAKGRLAKDDAAATAAFLFARREQLDKTVVGDFLGKELQYVAPALAMT